MKKFIISFDDFKNTSSLLFENEKFCFNVDDNSIIKPSDLKVSFKADKYGDIVSVTGNIFGAMSFECSRCLKLFEKDVNINFECSFGVEEYQMDISNEIKENIILNMPMQPLCKHNCKGICQVCGRNKNDTGCSCKEKSEEDFIAEKWSKIKNLTEIRGKNAKSKKKT